MISAEEKALALQDDGFGKRLGILLTGPEQQLLSLQLASHHDWETGGLEWFDCRGETWRCYYWCNGDINEALRQVEEMAKKHGLTLQLLCEEKGHASYPVVYLAQHGKQWEMPAEA